MKKKLFGVLMGVAFLICGCVSLTACGKEKNPELEIMTSENGLVEILAESNDMKCLKPVANDGYYFLKWNVYEDGKFRNEYFEGINWMGNKSSSAKKSYKIEAVFTDNADEFYFLPDDLFQIDGANDLSLDIEYLPYVAKERPSDTYYHWSFEEYDHHYYTPSFSYFIKPNENLALESISEFHSEDSGSFGGNSIDRLQWITPLSTYYCDSISYFFSDPPVLNNALQNIYIDVVDLRERPLVSIKVVVEGESKERLVDYICCEMGETVDITLSDKMCYNSGEQVHGYYFKEWRDENGNFISNKKYLTTTVSENQTYTAIMKKPDYVFEKDNVTFYFSENADHTLTLESFEQMNATTIEIPTEVEGKIVTGVADCFIKLRMGCTIIIPETVVNLGERAFMFGRNNGTNDCPNVILYGDRDINLDIFYGILGKEKSCSFIKLTETTLENMIRNEVLKLVKDASVEIDFVEDYSSGDLFPVYENGKFTIPKFELVGNALYRKMYTSNFFNALAQQIRMFYQDVALGNIDGLTTENLVVPVTQEQIDAWTTEEGRKTDAKEFAKKLLGFACLSSRGDSWNAFV